MFAETALSGVRGPWVKCGHRTHLVANAPGQAKGRAVDPYTRTTADNSRLSTKKTDGIQVSFEPCRDAEPSGGRVWAVEPIVPGRNHRTATSTLRRHNHVTKQLRRHWMTPSAYGMCGAKIAPSGPHAGLYADGVASQSPGSAQPRRGGVPPWAARLERPDYAEGVIQRT
jgi:hypothetical protein